MIRVRPRPAVLRDGWLRRAALVEGLPGGEAELWFDLEPRHASLVTDRADPWALTLVFAAMQAGIGLAVEGPVSRELLANLELLQAVWGLWMPDRYRPVALEAASEVAVDVGQRAGLAAEAGPAVLASAGGFDSCYTAWRHVRGLAGRQRLDIIAGLNVLGPVRPGVPETAAYEDARALLGDLGLDLWSMRTNVADFAGPREHAYGAVLAACLHWLSGGAGARVGVLASTGSLAALNTRCGSHPLTDPLLGSDRLRIVHDGPGRTLVEKARTVAGWPEAARRLAAGEWPDRVLAGLALAIADGTGGAAPGAVLERVRSLALDSARRVRDAEAILRAADAAGLQREPWYPALEEALARAAARPTGVSRRPADSGPHWALPRPASDEIRVTPEPPVAIEDRVVIAARITGLGGTPRRLWFSVEARHAPQLSPLADPFVCALQIPAMRAGARLVVEGPVSRVLLENLEQFQEVWHAWAPGEVTPVPMRADEEVEGAPETDEALVFFSGGMDSGFSAYRHHRGLIGRRSQRLGAAIMVRGFDIPEAERAEFRAAFENSRHMLGSLGVELWSMATNLRDLVDDWEPAHGTAIAACAHCFAGRFATALIASTAPANSLESAWGSHVMTDRLLSGDRLRVATDGEDIEGRIDKARLLAEWPEAMRRLRVCYLSPRRDRNCGECRKCLHTALAFLANGLSVPASLPRPSPRRIRRLHLGAAWEARAFDNVLERARAAGVSDQQWCVALRECVAWNEARWAAPDGGAPGSPLWRRGIRRVRRGLGRLAGGPHR